MQSVVTGGGGGGRAGEMVSTAARKAGAVHRRGQARLGMSMQEGRGGDRVERAAPALGRQASMNGTGDDEAAGDDQARADCRPVLG